MATERKTVLTMLDDNHQLVLPSTASVVGIDFNTGKQLYYDTSSHNWSVQTAFTGSVTKLTDGSDYLIASGAINLTTTSLGAVKVHVFEESGTFTPALSFSGGGTPAYASQVGAYYKIGRQVTVNFALGLSSINTSPAPTGNVSLINLPFTSQTSNDGAGGGTIPDYKNINNNNRVSSIFIRVGSNTTTASLYHVTNQTQNSEFLVDTNLSNTTQLSGSLYYIAAQ